MINIQLVAGDRVDVTVAAKGGGSENKSKFVMLNPSDSIVDWVLKTVPTMGAGWCPPGMLGIGIGGTAEKAMLLAKEALMDDIDMFDEAARAAHGLGETAGRAARQGERARHRRTGFGRVDHRARRQDQDVSDARGWQAGRDDSELRSNTARALRARRFRAAYIEPPSLDLWPDVNWQPDYNRSARVNLDTLTKKSHHGNRDRHCCSMPHVDGRDAAHKRIADMLAKNETLPVDFTNRVIYYVGPVDPVRNEVVGPAGPTTSTRMDKFTEMMLAQTGLIAMIGKAERGPVAIEAIRKHKSAYLMAVGGAAYLVAKAIKSARVIAFADLGMEAIYEFDVRDMPVTSRRQTAPRCTSHRPARVATEDRQDPRCVPEIEVRPAMQRIVVFGARSGKTTLGRWLSGQFDLPFADLTMCTGDRDGLKVRSLNSNQGRRYCLRRWIVAGNYSKVRDLLWPRDTLVWLDLPLMQVLWRTTVRASRQSWTGEAICNGNRQTLAALVRPPNSLLGYVAHFPRADASCRRSRQPEHAHATVVRLRRAAEVAAWQVVFSRENARR